MFSRILAWAVLGIAGLILLSVFIMGGIALWAEAGILGVGILVGIIGGIFALIWAIEELV